MSHEILINYNVIHQYIFLFHHTFQVLIMLIIKKKKFLIYLFKFIILSTLYTYH